MYDSRREAWGYNVVLDYHMSKEFGLDWKKHDFVRMQHFIKIMNLQAERSERESKKIKQPHGRSKATNHNRP